MKNKFLKKLAKYDGDLYLKMALGQTANAPQNISGPATAYPDYDIVIDKKWTDRLNSDRQRKMLAKLTPEQQRKVEEYLNGLNYFDLGRIKMMNAQDQESYFKEKVKEQLGPEAYNAVCSIDNPNQPQKMATQGLNAANTSPLASAMNLGGLQGAIQLPSGTAAAPASANQQLPGSIRSLQSTDTLSLKEIFETIKKNEMPKLLQAIRVALEAFGSAKKGSWWLFGLNSSETAALAEGRVYKLWEECNKLIRIPSQMDLKSDLTYWLNTIGTMLNDIQKFGKELVDKNGKPVNADASNKVNDLFNTCKKIFDQLDKLHRSAQNDPSSGAVTNSGAPGAAGAATGPGATGAAGASAAGGKSGIVAGDPKSSTSGAPGQQSAQGVAGSAAGGQTAQTQGATPSATSSGGAPSNLTPAEKHWYSQLQGAKSKGDVSKLLEQRNRYIDNMAYSTKDDPNSKLNQQDKAKYKERAQQIATPFMQKFNK